MRLMKWEFQHCLRCRHRECWRTNGVVRPLVVDKRTLTGAWSAERLMTKLEGVGESRRASSRLPNYAGPRCIWSADGGRLPFLSSFCSKCDLWNFRCRVVIVPHIFHGRLNGQICC